MQAASWVFNTSGNSCLGSDYGSGSSHRAHQAREAGGSPGIRRLVSTGTPSGGGERLQGSARLEKLEQNQSPGALRGLRILDDGGSRGGLGLSGVRRTRRGVRSRLGRASG